MTHDRPSTGEPNPPAPRAAISSPAGGGAIRVTALGKRFKLYRRPWDRLAEWLSPWTAPRHEPFWALRDVSFEVAPGESVGVIGANGSGKSTLLKILSGALHPTTGDFSVDGRVLSLLELGTGLNNELNGRQNVLASARMLGFPVDYAAQRIDQIEAFADLADGFFERPVRLYSSGMLVRLAFSMFACFEPDVFVIDEALSVGDVFFQQKCARRLAEMKSRGVTMLLVSHDLAAVEALCDRVIVLNHGRMAHDGDKKTGIRVYYACGGPGVKHATADDAAARTGDSPPRRSGRLLEESNGQVEPTPNFEPLSVDGLDWTSPDLRDAFGNDKVAITGISFRLPGTRAGGSHQVVEQGQWLEIFLRAEAKAAAQSVNLGLAIYDRMNRLVFARGWVNAELPPLDMEPGQAVVARFAVKLDLEPDEYTAALAASEAVPDASNSLGWNQHVGGERYCELPHAAVIAIIPRRDGRRSSFGPANLRSHLDGVILDGPNA